MAVTFLAISADGEGFVGILGRWPRISRQMAKNLSVFLPADCLEFLSKIGQEFVSILGRWSTFCQQMAKEFLAFWEDCPASLVG